MARSRLGRVRMDSSSLKESLSLVMVSDGLSVIASIAGFRLQHHWEFALCYLCPERHVDVLDDLTSFLFIFLLLCLLGAYEEEMCWSVSKLQWPALLRTLVFSVDHSRMLLLSTNGSISLNPKSTTIPISSIQSARVDYLITKQFVIHLPI